jgi:hypothetical protein
MTERRTIAIKGGAQHDYRPFFPSVHDRKVGWQYVKSMVSGRMHMRKYYPPLKLML